MYSEMRTLSSHIFSGIFALKDIGLKLKWKGRSIEFDLIYLALVIGIFAGTLQNVLNKRGVR